MSRYMSTAVDSAGLIVTFNKLDVPTYNIYVARKMLNIDNHWRYFFTVLVVASYTWSDIYLS